MRPDQFATIISGELSSQKLTLPAIVPQHIDVKILEDILDLGVESKITDLPFARTELQKVPIKESKVIFEGENVKKVIEIIFDLTESKVEFTPGDTIGILPENLSHEVDLVINALNVLSIADKRLEIGIIQGTKKKNAKIPNFIPEVSSIRTLLTKFLNIRTSPKKLLIRALIDHTSDDVERKFLEVLCSKEGGKLYTKCLEEKMTFLDLLKLCPSCHPPFGLLLEHLPRLLPRPYSIANSPLKTDDELKIIFSLQDGPNTGLTTSILDKMCDKFFEDKNNQCYVNLYFRNSNRFKYSEEDFSKNTIMIGVGVGIAPFLGFLEHQDELYKLNKFNTKGVTWLFTGSRYKENSLYKEEIQSYLQNGIINELYESYSRDSDCKYKYVQDHITANAKKFVDFIFLDNTSMYICADGMHITRDIEKTITDCIANVIECSHKEAKELVLQLKNNFKYIEDIWM